MDKKAVKEDFKKEIGGAFANISQIARYFGFSRNTVAADLMGVPYIPKGRNRYYFYQDVIDRYADHSKL